MSYNPTPEEVLEGNVAIAKMLGCAEEEWYSPNKETGSTGLYYKYQGKGHFPNNEKHCSARFLKYHSDWNWIMSAVEFVEKLGHLVRITGSSNSTVHQCFIDSPISADALHEDKKTAVFYTLVEFAKTQKHGQNTD
jgi:hypothetical protein